jgi:hypothetical protein
MHKNPFKKKCCKSCLVSVMLRALTRRLLYTEDLLGIDLREESIKLFLRWDYFLKVRKRMALPFAFTLPADSVCEFLITASAYVQMLAPRRSCLLSVRRAHSSQSLLNYLFQQRGPSVPHAFINGLLAVFVTKGEGVTTGSDLVDSRYCCVGHKMNESSWKFENMKHRICVPWLQQYGTGYNIFRGRTKLFRESVQ